MNCFVFKLRCLQQQAKARYGSIAEICDEFLGCYEQMEIKVSLKLFIFLKRKKIILIFRWHQKKFLALQCNTFFFL
jgi:hypothetical protein